MSDGQVGVEFDRMLVILMGGIQIVGHHEQRGPIGIRFGKLRIELNRAREIVKCFFELTGLGQQHATVVHGSPAGGSPLEWHRRNREWLLCHDRLRPSIGRGD